MRDFICPECGQQLAFENSVCLKCKNAIGYHPEGFVLTLLNPKDFTDPLLSETAIAYKACENLNNAGCNWILPSDSPHSLCQSCVLTQVRPNDDDEKGMGEFFKAEEAKRRLIAELNELRLPVVGKDKDPHGLAFNLLVQTDKDKPLYTGQLDGLITLNLCEADDVKRERTREAFDEPYRTLLGHFRHETGHYYFSVLVTDEDLPKFKELFGDPDSDYQAAIDKHYSEGPPADWRQNYVTGYATMHPAEDWAETFAHYLHMRDTLDTAAAFAIAPAGIALSQNLLGKQGFKKIMEEWLPTVWKLNMLSRSMGQPELYPFVLPKKVIEKIGFVHYLVGKIQTKTKGAKAGNSQ